MQAYASVGVPEEFAASFAQFGRVVEFLGGEQAAVLTHGQLEQWLHGDGLLLLRRLFQDSLDLRASREKRLEQVIDAAGEQRGSAEAGRRRGLATIFGQVSVARIAYRQRGLPDLHPADAGLNLPVEKHSHGLRRLAAVEAARGSYQAASAAIDRATGVSLGKRQVEELAVRAAMDVDAFYTQRDQPPTTDGDVLVLSFDGKGVVMRPQSLRTGTAAKAASRQLAGRLSRGEKRGRKRMAEVAAVYDLTPVPRTVTDILPTTDPPPTVTPGPKAANKWLTASITDNAAQVIATGFDEAERRDPQHTRTWIALVDGNNHQIDRIRAEAQARTLTVTIIIDFIHVMEYLWKAAWCFYTPADPQAEHWVLHHARNILHGNATTVAAAIRRQATHQKLSTTKRQPADTTADYLHAKKPHLNYPTALNHGWPIATGIIEGACRHLIKDRMDITGARWNLTSAEAILKLRALTTNGDLDTYWTWHLNQEQQRNHHHRYLHGTPPDN